VAFVIVAAGMSVWMMVPALMAEHLAGGFGGKAAGRYRLVTDFGFIVGPATVGWLVGRFGFAAGAAAIASVLVVSILLSPLSPRWPDPRVLFARLMDRKVNWTCSSTTGFQG
jgi:MFS family permease